MALYIAYIHCTIHNYFIVTYLMCMCKHIYIFILDKLTYNN